MDKTKARGIIKASLEKIFKRPGFIDLAKFIKVKNALEACNTKEELIYVLSTNRSLILKYLSETNYNACIEELRLL